MAVDRSPPDEPELRVRVMDQGTAVPNRSATSAAGVAIVLLLVGLFFVTRDGGGIRAGVNPGGATEDVDTVGFAGVTDALAGSVERGLALGELVPSLDGFRVAGISGSDAFRWESPEIAPTILDLPPDADGSWDPHATTVAFVADSWSDDHGLGALYVQRGSRAKPVFVGALRPEWHPADRSFVFMGRLLDEPGFGLYHADVPSVWDVRVRRLATLPAPADGTVPCAIAAFGDWGVALNCLVNGERHVLTISMDGEELGRMAGVTVVTAHPQGRLMILRGAPSDHGEVELRWTTPALDLTEPLELDVSPQEASQIVWMHDGSAFAVARQRSDVHSIAIVGAGTTSNIEIAAYPTAFSRDGRLLAAASNDGSGDFHLIDTTAGTVSVADMPGPVTSISSGLVFSRRATPSRPGR